MSEPHRKKLIEVALPLEAINRESAREKSIRQGHPSTLHLWWARRPLAACRAVLFASIVDDPSSRSDLFPTDTEQEAERQRLFRIIEELVKWENSNNEAVLEAARVEIAKATGGNPPPVLDPFCGGGSIPLEAQRLGLSAHGSDLNPVAVLITKALIEIPPRFAGQAPVNPDSSTRLGHSASWNGAQGLAEDVRYYGTWMRDEGFSRIGHLYPKATLTEGGEAPVIAWLWARTVTCPNPACGTRMPLVRSFALSTKPDKRTSVQPVVENGLVRFEVRKGIVAPDGTVGRRGAECAVCETSVPFEYIRDEARSGRMSAELMAIVAEGDRSRIYLDASAEHREAAASAEPYDVPETDLPAQALGFRVQAYGMTRHSDLFTPRQLVALTTFSDLVAEGRERVRADGGSEAYADAVATYLALAVSRVSDYSSTITTWASNPQMEILRSTFARQALPMTWDFAEGNVFGPSSGSLEIMVESVAKALERTPAYGEGSVRQVDANAALEGLHDPIVSTDPPYYDNIGYADLSDFFYVWLRRSLKDVYPNLFSTLLTPKTQELVATPYRFEGSRQAANRFFEQGLRGFFVRAREAQHPDFPMTLFYAFKQTEAEGDGGAVASTGWDTMLTGLVDSGYAVTGTWPVRTERSGRSVGIGTNALASSIVLVCRPRPAGAPVTDRRAFVTALRAEMPERLRELQHGNIAPVDLAQASIGPGMAIFSGYAKVVEASGDPMTVRTALGLINAALDDILTEQEGDFDADTRFAISWFEENGTSDSDFGRADVLARAKNTSVRGLEEAGIVVSRAGKVRLLGREELPEGWDPAADGRLTVWEVTQHLIRQLETGGEVAAAELLRRVGGLGETARVLAYRLFTICERTGWAQDALGYNALVVAWPEIARLAAEDGSSGQQQMGI